MSRHQLIYVDTSDVHDGAHDELRRAISALVGFVESNEPKLIAYNVYLSGDGGQMTVLQVHADSASLEYHMEVAGPVFRKLVDLVTVSSIRVYGEPSEKALRQLNDKARLFGCPNVIVHRLHAGFTRFAR